jgi:hypothetical protein
VVWMCARVCVRVRVRGFGGAIAHAVWMCARVCVRVCVRGFGGAIAHVSVYVFADRRLQSLEFGFVRRGCFFRGFWVHGLKLARLGSSFIPVGWERGHDVLVRHLPPDRAVV